MSTVRQRVFASVVMLETIAVGLIHKHGWQQIGERSVATVPEVVIPGVSILEVVLFVAQQ